MTTLGRMALALSLVILVMAACGDARAPGADESAALDAPAWVDDVADVASAIRDQPSATDSILTAHDMTRAELDSLLYEIAADPALTDAYQNSRER